MRNRKALLFGKQVAIADLRFDVEAWRGAVCASEVSR